MLFISNNSWFQLLRTIRLLFIIWKFFQNVVCQLKWYGLFPVMLMTKMIVVFITHACAVLG